MRTAVQPDRHRNGIDARTGETMTWYILRHAEKEAGDFYNPKLRHHDEPISRKGRSRPKIWSRTLRIKTFRNLRQRLYTDGADHRAGRPTLQPVSGCRRAPERARQRPVRTGHGRGTARKIPGGAAGPAREKSGVPLPRRRDRGGRFRAHRRFHGGETGPARREQSSSWPTTG
jgi:hypothetical protein